MAGRKELLTSDESHPIKIPNYYTIPDLQKDNLLIYCKNSQKLNKYLPDVENLKNIPREFLLQVSI